MSVIPDDLTPEEREEVKKMVYSQYLYSVNRESKQLTLWARVMKNLLNEMGENLP